jgi:hypothetical protein
MCRGGLLGVVTTVVCWCRVRLGNMPTGAVLGIWWVWSVCQSQYSADGLCVRQRRVPHCVEISCTPLFACSLDYALR